MFTFTQTIIRVFSACASLKFQCWLRLTEVNISEAHAESSMMMVYVNRNMLEQLL